MTDSQMDAPERVWRRPLVAFMDDMSDGNVERLERDEMAREAQDVLAVMMDRRWT